MNKRLVWNFEVSNSEDLDFHHLSDEKDEIRWEARYFWSEETIITLHGLNESFLALSNYEIKHRQDCYILLPDSPYNIKQRRSQLLYKPLIQEEGILRGYGKKIDLADYSPGEILPGTRALYAPLLLAEIQKNQREIEVSKEVLIYKLASQPKIKLELARLELAKKIYFSLSVEGRSKLLVNTLARHLLDKQVSCDYVNFLKQTLNHDH
mgnify:CR=1 FL=1